MDIIHVLAHIVNQQLNKGLSKEEIKNAARQFTLSDIRRVAAVLCAEKANRIADLIWEALGRIDMNRKSRDPQARLYRKQEVEPMKTEDIDTLKLFKSLVNAADKTYKCFKAWGPTDDGTKEGRALEDALTGLGVFARLAKKHLLKGFHEKQLTLLRKIVDAAEIGESVFDGPDDVPVYDDGSWFTVGLAKELQEAVK